jgi:hypothetical protein
MADNPRFGLFTPRGWRMDLAEIKDPAEQYEAMSRVVRDCSSVMHLPLQQQLTRRVPVPTG